MAISQEYQPRDFYKRKIYQKEDGKYFGRTPEGWSMITIYL